jgi:hypothetical protein
MSNGNASGATEASHVLVTEQAVAGDDRAAWSLDTPLRHAQRSLGKPNCPRRDDTVGAR